MHYYNRELMNAYYNRECINELNECIIIIGD